MWKISQRPFIHNHRPLIMAHRGESENSPENTLVSFEAAYKLGIDCIESDIHLTKDNQFVFFHDEKLNRTTNGDGFVSDFTLDELKMLDAGYYFEGNKKNLYPFRNQGFKIHSIDEIFPIFPNIRFNLDIKSKDPKVPELLAEKLDELKAEDRIIVGSFHQKQIKKFRKYSSITTAASPREVFKFYLKSKDWKKKYYKEFENDPIDYRNNQIQIFGKELPYFALQIPEKRLTFKLVSPEIIEFAHYLGIAVHVWTIKKLNDMKRLLNWGVDGIFTNNSAILVNLIKSMEI